MTINVSSVEVAMKYAVVVISLLISGQALAQTAPVIAPNGEYLGMAVRNGATTVFVDRNGQYGGAVVQNRAATAYFDRNGYQGVSPNVGPQRASTPGGYPPGYGGGPAYGGGYGPGGYGGRPYGYGGRPAYRYGGGPGYGYGYGYAGHRRHHHEWDEGW
jgi:hypothetical protein